MPIMKGMEALAHPNKVFESTWMEKHRMRRGYCGPRPIMYCRECKGSDASLTKHCVGRMLTDAEEADIEAGLLNFLRGEWVRR